MDLPLPTHPQILQHLVPNRLEPQLLVHRHNPLAYERFGYTNLFQAWNEVRPRLLPEEPSAKPLRQMIYMASGATVYLPSPTPVPVPAPMLLREFAAGLPYTGAQTRFTWVSVGEGYEVPRVQGVPAASYGEVTK